MRELLSNTISLERDRPSWNSLKRKPCLRIALLSWMLQGINYHAVLQSQAIAFCVLPSSFDVCLQLQYLWFDYNFDFSHVIKVIMNHNQLHFHVHVMRICATII